METIVRNVGEIEARDREALERVLGRSLRENQQLVIGIVNLPLPPETPAERHSGERGTARLPEWCDVYQGLSDEQVAEIEKSIVRSPGGRSFE